MPFLCVAVSCTGNYPTGRKVSIFKFPKDEILNKKWVEAINRENFTPTKSSRVCELHFEPSDILREASAFDPKTGRTLTAPLSVPRLREGAVPSLFPDPPKDRKRFKMGGHKPSKHRKIAKETKIQEDFHETEGNQLRELLETCTVIEPQNVVLSSTVIKEEPVTSTDEPSSFSNDNILFFEELATSSRSLLSPKPSSSSPCLINLQSTSSLQTSNSSAFHDDELDAQKPDSTNVKKSPATKQLSNNIVKPRTSGSTSCTAKAKVRKPTKPFMSSKRKRKLSSGSRMPKKYDSSSIPPINSENTTTELLQALMSDSENNPFFGSGTSERPGDLFDVFADFIAQRLREMNWSNCAFALRSILDIIFKAGQAQQTSEGGSDSFNPDAGSSSASDQE